MISVIIPAYNAENYVQQNYDSLLSQLDIDFEIIYINDGSTDNTYKILERIAFTDTRIKLINQENRGAMLARMAGLKNSSFNYVTFLDIDDTVTPNFISDFLNNLDKGYDLVATGLLLNKDGKLTQKNQIKPNVYSRNKYLELVLTRSSWELCGKAFNKKLFENICLPARPISIAEDTYIYIQTVLNCTSAIMIAKSYNYIYHSVGNSISKQKNQRFIEDAFYVGTELKKILIEKKINDVYISSMVLLLYSNSLRRGMISKKNPHFQIVIESFSINAMRKLPRHKSFFVFVFFFINYFLYN